MCQTTINRSNFHAVLRVSPSPWLPGSSLELRVLQRRKRKAGLGLGPGPFSPRRWVLVNSSPDGNFFISSPLFTFSGDEGPDRDAPCEVALGTPLLARLVSSLSSVWSLVARLAPLRAAAPPAPIQVPILPRPSFQPLNGWLATETRPQFTWTLVHWTPAPTPASQHPLGQIATTR